MVAPSKTHIAKVVDQLFAALNAKYGECCRNPITGGGFVWGIDSITTQKKEAIVALLAREWVAKNGPQDAPPLPLCLDDRDAMRSAGGLEAIFGFYARSLSFVDYDVDEHPSFDDFACGLMAVAVATGLWSLEKDAQLLMRFPPRPLEGMYSVGAYWSHPLAPPRAMPPNTDFSTIKAASKTGAAERKQTCHCSESCSTKRSRRGGRRSVAGTFAPRSRQGRF